MQYINLDREWTFRRGLLDSTSILESDPGVIVNLPHDGMIGTEVSADAPAKHDMGYFTGDCTSYTKYVLVPREWEEDCVGLSIDGAMMNATVAVNGCKVGSQHYGYVPFYVDLTDYVTFGEMNRITINTNTSAQPNSRWYTGSGLYRGVQLCHGPKVHIVDDGIFVYTKEVSEGNAFLEAQVEVENSSAQNRLVEVSLELAEEKSGKVVKTTKRVIQINAQAREIARMSFVLENPLLWDAEHPNLYKVRAAAADTGIYRTHFIPGEVVTRDEKETLFGIRTIWADVVRGLLINGKSVKLKGGCLHHDNGLLGAVSLYEIEARKIRKLKELGFNAIRTSHNPPSATLLEVCDREGMYVFDEAFDAWGMAKKGSDYSQYFDENWEKDLTAFVKRDRVHPSVIIWSTGNEIPERGGLNNGYTLATALAQTIRNLDGTRPISNAVCSMWSGLDDALAGNKSQAQNAAEDPASGMWEKITEPFTNGLDIVGYNYYEDGYEIDHEMFPDRVIMGSENFPKEIGFRWPLVEKLPYVIGEFTWTAWDYIGEAGLGKAIYADPNDPMAPKTPWDIVPQNTSIYPWRTANDADFDITGRLLPQGAYRSVVWGSEKTYVYTKHPDTFGKVEICTMWGFPYYLANWNYAGYENQPIMLTVFSNGDEVEVIVNGKSLGKKVVCMERPLPNTVSFETIYEPGEVIAISYKDGKEVSRDTLVTTKSGSGISLRPEKSVMKADGHDLICINIDICDEEGKVVPDACIALKALVEGAASLAGFGSGNPITDENYTDEYATSYRGHAMAILRAGYEPGEVVFKVEAMGICEEIRIQVED